MPKTTLISDHYAYVMLAEISPLKPRYHPNESPKLKTHHFNTIFVLLFKGDEKQCGISKMCEVC